MVLINQKYGWGINLQGNPSRSCPMTGAEKFFQLGKYVRLHGNYI